LFVGNVIPPYLEKAIDEIVKDFLDNELSDKYWSFIKISDKDWIDVKYVLEQWSKSCIITTEKMLNLTKQDYDYQQEMFFRLTGQTREKSDNRENRFYLRNQFIKPSRLVLDKNEEALIISNSSPETGDSNKKIRKYIEENWKTNKTMVDYDFYEFAGDRDLSLGFDFLQVCEEFTANNVSRTDSVYECFVNYFIDVASSVKNLRELKNFKIETHVGDVYDSILRVKLNSRNDKFDRIYLSNIADYSSLLSAFVDAIPMLKFQKTSFVKSSILLNNGLWANMDHYTYASTLMKSVKETRSLLNISLIEGDVFGFDPLWAICNQNFKPSLKSRNDIVYWLTRILFNYSYPSLRSAFGQLKECYCPNMTLFFKTIKFLVELGYPKHWFLQYLQSIESNNLVTLATYPELFPNRFKNNTVSKRIDLTAILLEFNTIAAIFSPLLNIGK
jgi:hypothetical protein